MRHFPLFSLFFGALLLSFSSCQGDAPQARINPILHSYIASYIQLKEQEHTAIYGVAVELVDDSTVYIMEAFPGLEEVQMLGRESVKGYPVIFKGKPNQAFYYISSSDIAKKTIPKTRSPEKGPPPRPVANDNYELWTLHFRRGTLVSYSPQDRIDKLRR
ncbi:hypothetical protein [Hymenobacter lapidiphilus]|uniref:Uncharacterized protein n=1 Tax=Hymenobacter lapidiphilus TaxID=2608003 RepID=A0A7Y7PQR8_9BACT|nr:hypothetical protein [Hymenobacter lapidiphilus]NVO32306.1 hypothetical protein [Hymenobacter lapidiphilus]